MNTNDIRPSQFANMVDAFPKSKSKSEKNDTLKFLIPKPPSQEILLEPLLQEPSLIEEGKKLYQQVEDELEKSEKKDPVMLKMTTKLQKLEKEANLEIAGLKIGGATAGVVGFILAPLTFTAGTIIGTIGGLINGLKEYNKFRPIGSDFNKGSIIKENILKGMTAGAIGFWLLAEIAFFRADLKKERLNNAQQRFKLEQSKLEQKKANSNKIEN